MNYRIEIQYDGTRYNGWQRQPKTKNTIQEKLENILTKMAGSRIEINGSGRTDAGVHALAQIANFHMDIDMSEDEIRIYMNQYLPEDISITKVEMVPERFHARFHAVGKIYIYRIGISDCKKVFERKYIYPLGQNLDITAMRQAAALLTGTHDFMSFCANKRMKKSTIRTLQNIDIEERNHELTLVFRGNGFLHHMVRILTGTLIEVGQGRRSPLDMTNIFKSQNRRMAGETAPAKGLTLQKVLYKGEA